MYAMNSNKNHDVRDPRVEGEGYECALFSRGHHWTVYSA